MTTSQAFYETVNVDSTIDDLIKNPTPSLRGAKRRGNPTCNESRPEAAVGGSKDLSLSRGDPSLLSGQCFALDCRASLAMTERARAYLENRSI